MLLLVGALKGIVGWGLIVFLWVLFDYDNSRVILSKCTKHFHTSCSMLTLQRGSRDLRAHKGSCPVLPHRCCTEDKQTGEASPWPMGLALPGFSAQPWPQAAPTSRGGQGVQQGLAGMT